MSNLTPVVSEKNYIKLEIVRTFTSNTKALPVPAWRRIIHCLTEKEQGICALVSRRLRTLALYDPSIDLENMHKRKAVRIGPITALPQAYGPCHHFLYSDSLSLEDSFEIEEFIQSRTQKDPYVAKTVLDVCKIESIHPEYIPLYHAMNITTYIFSLFTRILLKMPYLPNEKFPCSAPIIRFPSPDGPKTIEELFRQYPLRNPTERYDHRKDVQKELLALNPHLFANMEKRGESTWDLYLENESLDPPNSNVFFKMLCAHYKLSFTQEHIDKLIELQSELVALTIQFERLNLEDVRTLKSKNRGILLQILVPLAVLDQVAYASRPFGKINKESDLPLSERCLRLRSNPRIEPNMQIRLLAQSIFVPHHHIKVFTHGCGDFLSNEELIKPDKMNEVDWVKQEKRIVRKKAILNEARELFSKMMLFPTNKKT